MPRVLDLPCESCGAPLGGGGYAPLSVLCAACDESEPIRIDVDGGVEGVPGPDPTVETLTTWARAVREVASGVVVCLGGCRRCRGPLLAPSVASVRLACDQCGGHRDLPLGEVVSQPIHEFSGHMHSNISARANFKLEYEIERVEASSPGGHHCPRCGAAVPPGHQSDDCEYCGSRLWMIDEAGRRFTYVLSVKGHRQGEPVDQRLPLHEAEEVITQDMELFRAAVATTRKVRAVLSALALFVLVVIVLLLFFFVRSIQDQFERVWPQQEMTSASSSGASWLGRSGSARPTRPAEPARERMPTMCGTR